MSALHFQIHAMALVNLITCLGTKCIIPSVKQAMSRTKALVSFQCLSTPSSTFLPFLYQTRTIQCCACRQSLCKTQPGRRSQRQFSVTTHRRADHDAIPFERSPRSTLEPTDSSSLNPALLSLSKITKSQDTTITNSEKAVFDRIFKDIASASAVQRDKPQDDVDLEVGAYFEDLDQIFDDAISSHEKKEAAEVRASTEQPYYPRHPLLERMTGLGSLSQQLPPPRDWGRPGRIGSESISDLSTAHQQHRTKVFGMFEAAQTDVEVWRVLETEVFTLVEELNARIKEHEKATKGKKSKTTKTTKAGLPSLQAPKVGRPSKKSPAAAKAGEANTPKALPPTVLLSILTTEYPLYLVACCRLLRRSFPLSPYPLVILSHVKRLGPLSYVLGASANLYNETLYLLWATKNDLHGMADLLQEMRNQGVESNDVTVAFLKGVQRRRRYELSGQNGVWRQKWWGMAPVEEGWERLCEGLEVVLQEQRERIARAAEEATEEREVREEEDVERPAVQMSA